METQAGTGIPPEAEAPLAEMSELPEAEGQMDLFEEKLLEPQSRSRHKLIGQLFATYWLVEFRTSSISSTSMRPMRRSCMRRP